MPTFTSTYTYTQTAHRLTCVHIHACVSTQDVHTDAQAHVMNARNTPAAVINIYVLVVTCSHSLTLAGTCNHSLTLAGTCHHSLTLADTAKKYN